ncbi:MAG: hypothetical protein EOO40_09650 [Deltaproteobacteria bacterium]|nr:MAG: hypothetical protein EOO40_09650 [Deltaproteobacteria bacterium]
MGVHLDLSLDADGHHTFQWRRSDEPGALQVAPDTLQRWTAEHEQFRAATARWQQVMAEVDEHLLGDRR